MPQYYASNPANTRVNILHFLLCDLKTLVLCLGLLILAGFLYSYSWKGALASAAVGLIFLIMEISTVKNLFSDGNVCPAIVVDPKRRLVATYSDLTKGRGFVPAIRILKLPLDRVTGGPFKKGTRLAYVAFYNGFDHQPRWKSFGGYLINSATKKKRVIQRVVKSIPDEDWRYLKAGLSQISQPFRQGQYEDLDF